jgi:hypothetical protein
LIPGQSAAAIAAELIVPSMLLWAVQMNVQLRNIGKNRDHPKRWFVQRMALTQLATLPFAIAGAAVAAGLPHALYWIAPGFLFSFGAGASSAWVLLVEIMR